MPSLRSTPKRPHLPSRASSTSTTSTTSSSSSSSVTTTTTRSKVVINIYDLLPPGRLSTLLWTLGSSLLHSGVVLHSREFAYGGHNKRATTGVYSTPPGYPPPGSTHRLSIPIGYTSHSPQEIENILRNVSEKFLGPSYNLLTHNCNHFTAALVLALTGHEAPKWLNRAASIGLALPCVVPREWISPPDAHTAEGELLNTEEDEEEENINAIATAVYKDTNSDDDDDNDGEADERASMLESERHRRLRDEQRRTREIELRARRELQAQRQGSNAANRLSVASINRSLSLAGSATPSSTSGDGEILSLAGGKRITTVDDPPARLVKRVDSAGRELPVAERAPVPRAAVMRT